MKDQRENREQSGPQNQPVLELTQRVEVLKSDVDKTWIKPKT
jgi:hypothetical protein